MLYKGLVDLTLSMEGMGTQRLGMAVRNTLEVLFQGTIDTTFTGIVHLLRTRCWCPLEIYIVKS